MKKAGNLLTVFDFEKIAFTDDGEHMLILGYRVDFTDKEIELVKILHGSKKSISKTELAERADISDTALAVHIANINKKALPITGRKLIEGNRRGYYKISEYM